jgi:glycosyltransferase involved in cell wall biosynthesis
MNRRLVWLSSGGGSRYAEIGGALRSEFFVTHLDASARGKWPEAIRQSGAAIVIAEAEGIPALLKAWLSVRLNRPSALFGGVLNDDRDRGGWWRKFGRRLLRTVADFTVLGSDTAAALVQKTGFPRRRICVTTDGRELPAFLIHRLKAEANSILWVDPNIHKHSPAMKNLVATAPLVVREGWELRLWCMQTEIGEDIAEITRLRVPSRISALMILAFILRANLQRLWFRFLKGRPPARLIHSCGSYYLGAQMVSFHFSARLWFKKQMELRFERLRDVLDFAFTAPAVLTDALQYRHRGCQLFLPVSDSLANEVRGSCRREAEVVVVPSAYDPEHFNLRMREQWREPIRGQLGIADDMRLLAFVSQGSYRRKGLWLALEALQCVRTRNPGLRFKFMIIGGKPDRIEALKAQIATRHPDWTDWIFFTGFVPDLAHYLAAADGFLFPSYFESFAAVEVEAAAMGVPLLLTQHFGSEMVLAPGSNGLLLPWSAEAMALDLEKFLADGIRNFHPSVGKGISRDEFHQRILGLYRAFLAPPEPAGPKS